MGLLGAPVLSAARGVASGIGGALSRVLASPTARAVGVGAATSAAVDYFTGPSTGMPGGLFQQGMPRARPLRRIIQQNPVTGQLAVWEYAGTPILFSRDLAVARRVAKIMGRGGPRRSVARRRFR